MLSILGATNQSSLHKAIANRIDTAIGVTIATVQNPTLRPAGADGSWRDQASVRLEGLVEMIGLCPDALGFPWSPGAFDLIDRWNRT